MDAVLCNSEEPSRRAAVDVFAEIGVEVTTEDWSCLQRLLMETMQDDYPGNMILEDENRQVEDPCLDRMVDLQTKSGESDSGQEGSDMEVSENSKEQASEEGVSIVQSVELGDTPEKSVLQKDKGGGDAVLNGVSDETENSTIISVACMEGPMPTLVAKRLTPGSARAGNFGLDVVKGIESTKASKEVGSLRDNERNLDRSSCCNTTPVGTMTKSANPTGKDSLRRSRRIRRTPDSLANMVGSNGKEIATPGIFLKSIRKSMLLETGKLDESGVAKFISWANSAPDIDILNFATSGMKVGGWQPKKP